MIDWASIHQQAKQDWELLFLLSYDLNAAIRYVAEKS